MNSAKSDAAPVNKNPTSFASATAKFAAKAAATGSAESPPRPFALSLDTACEPEKLILDACYPLDRRRKRLDWPGSLAVRTHRCGEASSGYSNRMNTLERQIRRIDHLQARHGWLAFVVGVVKKYGDDQGGRLAALIAFYGFFSFFPLMLVFVSVLGYVLSGDPGLRHDIVDSAFGQFPVIGNAIRERANVHALHGNWLAVAIGAATALWAGLGVAQATQTAMNTIWDVPRASWPNFLFRRLRALATLLLLGTIVVVSTIISGFGSSGASSPQAVRLGGWAVALLLNLVLFTLAYQLLTARRLKWREVVPGAAAAALGWTLLQALGGYIVTHQIRSASDVYGTFALVLALLVWISLGAQLTLFCAEINVVLHQHFWPRNIVQPPLSNGDVRVYSAIVRRARMRPELEVDVRLAAGGSHDNGGDAETTPVGTARARDASDG
jgi:YihY family inner membrane protein